MLHDRWALQPADLFGSGRIAVLLQTPALVVLSQCSVGESCRRAATYHADSDGESDSDGKNAESLTASVLCSSNLSPVLSHSGSGAMPGALVLAGALWKVLGVFTRVLWLHDENQEQS